MKYIILPALATSWPECGISGLRAKGGYSIALSWNRGQLTRWVIAADKAGDHTVRYGNKVMTVHLKKGANTIAL